MIWRPAILLCSVLVVSAARAQTPAAPDELEVHFSATTGYAAFVTPKGGPSAFAARSREAPLETAGDFVTRYGHLFGVSDAARELRATWPMRDRLGNRHTTYHQVFKGVPVFSGMIKVHEDALGRFAAANGAFYSIPDDLDVIPSLDSAQAEEIARSELPSDSLTVERSQLVIVDPSWYGDPPLGPHLARLIVLADPQAGIREAFFIDAHTGAILDRWEMTESALNRRIHDAQFTANLPGFLVRREGSAPRPDVPEADRAYDYAADVHGYYSRGFNRDSFDNRGSIIRVTVRSTILQDGFWTGPPRNQIVFFPGLGLVTDDFLGHELTHGVTQFSAALIYQNQPGQLNESFSDVFGELVDLFNGNAAFAGPPGGPPNWPVHPSGPGLDVGNQKRGAGCSFLAAGYPDGVRWLIFEDTNRGGSRDMWNPPCFDDPANPLVRFPDRVTSPSYVCGIPQDNGGVHFGSSVPNHAFAILTDGKDFNGQNVTGIGPIKAGAVWYRALTQYLTPASNFQDAFLALDQAAADLVGSFPRDPRTGQPSADMFTAADAQQADRALRAVEMNVAAACGATRNYIFLVDTTGSAAGVNPFYNAIIASLAARLDAIPGPDRCVGEGDLRRSPAWPKVQAGDRHRGPACAFRFCWRLRLRRGRALRAHQRPLRSRLSRPCRRVVGNGSCLGVGRDPECGRDRHQLPRSDGRRGVHRPASVRIPRWGLGLSRPGRHGQRRRRSRRLV
jgi:Zn-dependent metalloprotease